MLELSADRFEELVADALDGIPTELLDLLDNVVIQVEDDAPDHEPGLLGLYEGVPLTTYGQARMPHPEIITIYERTIVDYCNGDPDRIRRQVRHTVLHEVAHHFGIDHEEMPIWIR